MISETEPQKTRFDAPDILRGLAVVCMIFSNIAGESLNAPHPFVLRIFGSLAAPFFVFLSGYMLSYAYEKYGDSLGYFLKRGLFLIGLSSAIDIFFWKSFPMLAMDVLYLIGLSTVLMYWLLRRSTFSRFIILSCAVLAAPALQYIFGYENSNNYVNLYINEKFNSGFSPDYAVILKRWMIDGWFPVFPWISFSLLGTVVYDRQRNSEYSEDRVYYYIASFIGLLGILIWDFEPKLEIRDGYTELFYPPTVSYFLCYFGLVLVIFQWVSGRAFGLSMSLFRMLGRGSLFYYVLHFACIIFYISPLLKSWGRKFSIGEYLLAVLCVIGVSFVFSFLLDWIRKKYPNMPFLLKMFIG